jgi:hypothetical protein
MTLLLIALIVVALLVGVTVAVQRRKPSPRARRGDPVQRRREERELL